MNTIKQFRHKPTTISAIRYGDEETGEYSRESLLTIANFLLDNPLNGALNDEEVAEVCMPSRRWGFGNWDIFFYDSVIHLNWLPLKLGDWLARGVWLEFYPVDPKVLEAAFDEEVKHEE